MGSNPGVPFCSPKQPEATFTRMAWLGAFALTTLALSVVTLQVLQSHGPLADVMREVCCRTEERAGKPKCPVIEEAGESAEGQGQSVMRRGGQAAHGRFLSLFCFPPFLRPDGVCSVLESDQCPQADGQRARHALQPLLWGNRMRPRALFTCKKTTKNNKNTSISLPPVHQKGTLLSPSFLLLLLLE